MCNEISRPLRCCGSVGRVQTWAEIFGRGQRTPLTQAGIERDTRELEACVNSMDIDSMMLLADLAMMLDVQRTISASTSLFGPVSSRFSSAQYTWAIMVIVRIETSEHRRRIRLPDRCPRACLNSLGAARHAAVAPYSRGFVQRISLTGYVTWTIGIMSISLPETMPLTYHTPCRESTK
jgi:hypothetical protein